MTNFLFVVFKLEILKEIAILKRDRYRIFHENSYYFRYLFKKVKFCYAFLV
ncbi:amino acid permease [Enterococcus faecalis]|nr:amino acid permease [Enterococcus faecalis]